MILMTGASGFLGQTVLNCLPSDTAVTSIGRTKLEKVDNHCICDLSAEIPNLPKSNFEKVIHLAGKAHSIPKTEEAKNVFFDTNFQGTLNLLTALDKLPTKPKVFVFSSTVAVYGVDVGVSIKESHPLNSETPYGKSKIQAEKVIEDWCIKNNVHFLILRLPLIVGTNPPGNLGTMKEAISKGRYPRIGKNIAKKSMVLAKDVADLMINHQSGSGIYNLTDGIHPHFFEVENAIERRVGKTIKFSIPASILTLAGYAGDVFESITKKTFPISSLKLQKLTSTLTFDDVRARKELTWNPSPVLSFIEKEI